MCGILGIVSKHKPNIYEFNNALSTLNKRGPDARAKYIHAVGNTHISFGHTRLAIVDLSKAGIQPMHTKDKSHSIIFNGEIYNFQELRDQLLKKKYQFKSKTDTEVLMNGYKEYKQNIVKLIEGMFAFCIIDNKSGNLFLARDHFGKKPLYYYKDRDTFIFASGLKALLQFKIVRKNISINSISVLKYLFYGYVPSPHTLFKGIAKLEPATCFTFDIKKWKITHKYEYWKPQNIALQKKYNRTVTTNILSHLISNSVKKRLIADVPIGIFLSGGVDSGLIAAHIKKHAKKVTAYTITYRNDTEYKDAKQIARHLGIKTKPIEFNIEKAKYALHHMLNYLDEPTADAAIIPLYYISSRTKKHITVVLSGDGGDELFGGYDKYKTQLLLQRFSIFEPIVKLVSTIASSSFLRKLGEGFSIPFYARQFIFGSGSFLPDEVQKLFQLPKLDIGKIFEDARRHDKRFRQKDDINRSLYLDCKIQIPDWYLMKGDRATMAASLEMRNPLLDKSLAEFMFSLPGSEKVTLTKSKVLLKDVAKKYLPISIVNKPKKGFPVPLDLWLSKIIDIRNYQIKSKYLRTHINKAYFEYQKNKFYDKNDDTKYKLYRIYILDQYLKRYEQEKF